MPECSAIGERKFLRIFSVPRLEFFGGGFVRRGYVFRQKLHFLRHAPLHDGVVLIQSHREALAIQNFLADESFHQSAEFFRRRLAMPLRDEGDVELADIVEADDDLMVHVTALPAVHVAVDDEQSKADQ